MLSDLESGFRSTLNTIAARVDTMVESNKSVPQKEEKISITDVIKKEELHELDTTEITEIQLERSDSSHSLDSFVEDINVRHMNDSQEKKPLLVVRLEDSQ